MPWQPESAATMEARAPKRPALRTRWMNDISRWPGCSVLTKDIDMKHSKRFQADRRRHVWVIRTAVLVLITGVGAFAGAQTGSTAATAVPAAPVNTVRVSPRVEAVVSMRDRPVISAAAVPAH